MKFSAFVSFALSLQCATSARVGSRVTHRKLSELPSHVEVIKSSFVVVYNDTVVDINQQSQDLVNLISFQESGAILKSKYNSSLKGIALDNVSNNLLLDILNNPDVVRVVPNNMLGFKSIQLNPLNWGLDRIDQRNLPLDNVYKTQSTGNGVSIYMIDSGYQSIHQELIGDRISCGFDGMNDSLTLIPCDDLVGHGTMQAGLAGGNYVGVAKNATLVSVKIGSKEGPIFSVLLDGIEYVTNVKLANPTKPMVATLSIGGYFEEVLDQAVLGLIAAGVTVVTAAGNESMDACYASPARVKKAITVGASGITDALWNETNYGPCVDLFAPGDLIYHPWRKNSTHYVTASGTSQSVPIVAGVVALLLERNPLMKPAHVREFLINKAVRGALVGPYDNSTLAKPSSFFISTKTPNRLLNIRGL